MATTTQLGAIGIKHLTNPIRNGGHNNLHTTNIKTAEALETVTNGLNGAIGQINVLSAAVPSSITPPVVPGYQLEYLTS